MFPLQVECQVGYKLEKWKELDAVPREFGLNPIQFCRIGGHSFVSGMPVGTAADAPRGFRCGEEREGQLGGAVVFNACHSLCSILLSSLQEVISKHLFLGHWGLVTSHQGTKLQLALPLSLPPCPCLGGIRSERVEEVTSSQYPPQCPR